MSREIREEVKSAKYRYLLPVNQTVTSKKHTHTKAHLVEVPGVVVAGHLVDDGRDAVADVGEGPLLILEERVTLHRIRPVKTQPRRPENSEIHSVNYLA